MNINFISRWTILTAFLLLGVLILKHTDFLMKEEPWYWATVIFFAVLSLVVGYISLSGVNSTSNAAFLRSIFGAMGIRIFFSLIFLVIYLFISELQSTQYIVFFLVLYLFYTLFEIYFLLSKLRPEKKADVESTTN